MNEHKICINEACSTAQVLYDRKKKSHGLTGGPAGPSAPGIPGGPGSP